MSIDLYTTKISDEVLSESSRHKSIYRKYPDLSRYFCFVDLKQSTNYRISFGLEKGYIRGESFFSLVKASIRPYTGEITLVKEIGDAVLLCSESLRPLLECSILITRAADQLSFLSESEEFPFAVRVGIDFGLAKLLHRPDEDYLGDVIDRLARIMGIRSQRSDILIGENAHSQSKQVIEEYSTLINVSGPIQASLGEAKALASPVIYRELTVLREASSRFEDYFEPWRQSR